jgi:hypothetical protein
MVSSTMQTRRLGGFSESTTMRKGRKGRERTYPTVNALCTRLHAVHLCRDGRTTKTTTAKMLVQGSLG